MHAATVFPAVLGLASRAWTAPIPANETTAVAPAEKRWTHGSCGFHVHIRLQDGKQTASVKLYDGRQDLINSGDFEAKMGDNPFGGATDGLDGELVVMVFPSNANVVEFEYGGARRGSGHEGTQNEHCKVGNRDHSGIVGTWEQVDLDCGFDC
ncbi:hypothetical protein PG996_015059 [Apiospora saccharicola]|uniref:Uncharacterized protein n=1 Tax=Apiospora saccharicola TaxID=335842 RepID=A0ABR1TK26_9PEZI